MNINYIYFILLLLLILTFIYLDKNIDKNNKTSNKINIKNNRNSQENNKNFKENKKLEENNKKLEENNKNLEENNKDIKQKNEILYYKCDKFVMNKIVKDIFLENNIKRTYSYNDKWLLFMPCTYNNVETELRKIKNLDNKLIFGIHGCDLIVSKNNIWRLLENKHGRKTTIKLMPETFILSDKNQMDLFKKIYDKNDTYIMKKNIQRKQGLLLTSNFDTIVNNKDSKFRIVQKYMKNTFMINKRKLNLRIYLLIVIKNNKLTSYYYKNGKCIYTNKDYNNTLKLEENITSLNMDQKIYKKNPFDLFELAQYLGINNYNALLYNLKLNLKKLEECYKDIILKLNKNDNSNTHFQLFGLDYIFSNNLHVYLLELNKGPDMSSKNEKDYILKYRVYQDLFNLVNVIDNDNNDSNNDSNNIINKNMFEKI